MFADIQGHVCRTQQLGELRLTETVYAPGSRLPEHEHEYGCFGLMLEGVLQEQFGSRTLVYKQSTVFFRPPEVTHRDHIKQGARCFHIEISPRWLNHVSQISPVLREVRVLNDPAMHRLARRIYHEWLQPDAASQLAIEGLTYEMAAYLCRNFSPAANSPIWLRKVHEVIETRYRDKLSLRDVATAVSLNPIHVARQFRRYVGISVGCYIRSRRIEFARHELATTDKPLIDIALESGFASQSQFTTTFRHFTGTTPSEYRNSVALGRQRIVFRK